MLLCLKVIVNCVNRRLGLSTALIVDHTIEFINSIAVPNRSH
jgi:hypothetical protein